MNITFFSSKELIGFCFKETKIVENKLLQLYEMLDDCHESNNISRQKIREGINALKLIIEKKK